MPAMAMEIDGAAIAADRLLDILDRSAEDVTLPAHDTFAIEGEPAVWLWRLEEGTVRQVKLMADGRQQIVGFPTFGDWIGLAAEGRYCASAETTRRSRLEAGPADGAGSRARGAAGTAAGGSTASSPSRSPRRRIRSSCSAG